METYEGIPEFDIADHLNYDIRNGPVYLRFHTPIGEDDTLPLPPEHSLNHGKMTWELERWTLFKQLPQML